ncbi:putative protein kinase RLK-Pelle-RLCK-VIIa-2 family [Helianthus annuus]|uniref:Protein kinase domain-containing protein n=1 Tax=Helianthus annuus TaxID=4232 RepID=A0A251TFR4_HELAN|nr:putative protein kinase RLK-Pelle-RLCK-VIIa-2 family [Helianthus annuus]KAJ0519616.1 putative protein kinase RLK-Pelle-RLCK-VIIa-2 family [Helianthus annuus]KAJ0691397.1 putative protein kinase RLK-Pelle-RLCK-VIIa-2 family [Helianthus annuus]
MGTQNFSDRNCIEVRRHQKLYAGQVAHAYGFTPCVVKVNNRMFFEHEKEVEFLLKYKHENIIVLLGYCNENQGIIVYENVSKGGLSKYLKDPSITWMKRLKISIGVAKGCAFLHTSGVEIQHALEDIGLTTDSILLDGDWNAKICPYNELEYFRMHLTRRQGIIYSLGGILLDMLRGRFGHRWAGDPNVNLDNKMLFSGTKEPISPQSVITFQNIAMRCLHDETEASEVVIQLEKALEFQVSFHNFLQKVTNHQDLNVKIIFCGVLNKKYNTITDCQIVYWHAF